MYADTISQLTKMLRNLQQWLREAAEYAETRGFHPDNYLTARLYLDQFTLTQQVQAACDSAKGLAARLTGQAPPRHEDSETTFEQLQARVQTVLDYLAGFSAADFDGADARIVPLPFLPGKGSPARAYVHEFAVPNFYFHATSAYAILRHCGVKLGKRAYIGGMEIVDLPQE